jgi:hypothetical protein
VKETTDKLPIGEGSNGVGWCRRLSRRMECGAAPPLEEGEYLRVYQNALKMGYSLYEC